MERERNGLWNGKEKANINKEKNMGIWEKIYCVIERINNIMGRNAYSVPYDGRGLYR